MTCKTSCPFKPILVCQPAVMPISHCRHGHDKNCFVLSVSAVWTE